MFSIHDIFLALTAVLPGIYSVICWSRRRIWAEKKAGWARKNYPDAWDSLPWLTRRHPGAAVEVLIRKGVIDLDRAERLNERYDYLGKAAVAGILLFSLLSLIFIIWKFGNITPG